MTIVEAQALLLAAGARQVVIHEIHVCTPEERRAPRYLVVAQYQHPEPVAPGSPTFDLRSGSFASLEDAVRRVNPQAETVEA